MRRVLAVGPIAVPFRVRPLVTAAVVAAVALAIAVATLATGELRVPVSDVVAALTGQGSGLSRIVVLEWRLPRTLAALVLGGALGLSGAIFQSLTRNPLGSPDVIGFGTGAYTGALVVLLVLGGSHLQAGGGALIGGLATAAVVQVFAHRRGASGLRLILVGIAVSAMLAAVNHWLLLRAEVESAMAAATWGAGNLNGLRWVAAAPAIVMALVVAVAALLCSRPLHLLAMGDDTAQALGLDTRRWWLVLVVVGVALTAAATAAAGPIAFVALAAPQLARLLSRTPGADLVGSAAMGGLLLVAADLVAQRAFAPIQLPVGIVTGTVGGLYLIWLLVKEARTR